MQPAPENIFHHHRGVIDEDADREDQRKQAYAVDRITQRPGGPDGNQNDDGDDGDDHDSGAPSYRDPGEQGHRCGGPQQ